MKKINFENMALYGALVLAVVGLLVTAYFYIWPMMNGDKTKITGNAVSDKRFTKVSFTEFDIQKAKEIMDKNNDGKCDICGMRIEDCIDSGMMQCSMDPNPNKIGLLRSVHNHIDFKVYLDRKQLDLSQEKYFVKSKFVHVENDGQDKTGNVLHIHAENVPLSLFFESIDLELKNIKVYVNGKINNNGLNYIPSNADKVLITDSLNQEEINKQLSTITSFSPK